MEYKISVILPCLNEENTIEFCINKAFEGINNTPYKGEVIVSDNGSTDNSVKIAKKAGAKIVNIKEKGYGYALRGGIEAANYEFIIMGDSDSTYDFTHIERFTNKLADGFELVVGNRFKGGIEKNAMPPLNKYIGNPLLTYIAKKLFNSKIGDFHCGLRAFTKKAYEKMELKSTGMEFATEMIAKSSLLKLKITEVPTTLKISINPRKPHLKPFRDGLRHLNLMFTYSFLKLSKFGVNLFIYLFSTSYVLFIFLSPVKIGSVNFSTGTLNVLENILLMFLVLKTMLGISNNFFPDFLERDNKTSRNYGLLFLTLGISIYIYDLLYWKTSNFGQLNDIYNLKLVSIGSLLTTYGIFEIFRSVIETSINYFKD